MAAITHKILLTAASVSVCWDCRWCSEDGKRFGADIDAVAPPVPREGWYVHEAWHTVATSTDPDGWQYASIITSPYWHPSQESGTCESRNSLLAVSLQRRALTAYRLFNCLPSQMWCGAARGTARSGRAPSPRPHSTLSGG